MTVYKRKLSPFWQIEFKYRGKRIRQSSGTTTKRDAQELERKLRRGLHDRLVMGNTVEMSLGEAIDRYYETVLIPKDNPLSAQRDCYVLNGIKKSLNPKTPLASINAPILTSYRDHLLQEGKAPATANRYLSMIKAILNRANKEWGALTV